ncbi:DUF6783 domain-containing protein [Ruminococcus sp. 1001275B_160808_F8]|uniref:DUF6783 domain-containing protein n=1 Tax=Ruminococcus sp. 1001275B_160808_F8 TaxID=2787131 RepID=UPI00325FA742
MPSFSRRSPLRRPQSDKSPTNCEVHLAESLFQTRSRACFKHILDNTTCSV